MSNALIAETKTLTTSYVAVSNYDTVASVEIAASPSNTGVAYIQGTDGTDVPLIAGEWKRFEQIKLSYLKLKGTVSDIVTVIGVIY